MDLLGNPVFMGELASTVSRRRFFVGEAVSETEKSVQIKYAFCMDEVMSKEGVNYVMLPDPLLFSDEPTQLNLDKFIAHRKLNKLQPYDLDMINNYYQNVNNFRMQKSGIVNPQSASPGNIKPLIR